MTEQVLSLIHNFLLHDCTTIERQNLMYILSVYSLDCCTFSILNKGYSTHIIRSYGKYRSVNLVFLYVVSSPYDGKNENVLGRSSVLHFFSVFGAQHVLDILWGHEPQSRAVILDTSHSAPDKKSCLIFNSFLTIRNLF